MWRLKIERGDEADVGGCKIVSAVFSFSTRLLRGGIFLPSTRLLREAPFRFFYAVTKGAALL